MKKKFSLALIAALTVTNVFCQSQMSVDIPDGSSILVAQRQSSWCWAACNSMLLKAKNIEFSQEDQVTKLFGRLVNQGAGPDYENARRALAGTYTTAGGRSVTITPYISYLQARNPSDPVVIINHLRRGIPLVMATSIHGRVCVGVDYITDGQRYQITRIRLLNPANGGKLEQFTMAQFLQEGLIGFMTFDMQ